MKKNLKFILLSFFALLLFSCGTILLTHDFSPISNETEVEEENLDQGDAWYVVVYSGNDYFNGSDYSYKWSNIYVGSNLKGQIYMFHEDKGAVAFGVRKWNDYFRVYLHKSLYFKEFSFNVQFHNSYTFTITQSGPNATPTINNDDYKISIITDNSAGDFSLCYLIELKDPPDKYDASDSTGLKDSSYYITNGTNVDGRVYTVSLGKNNGSGGDSVIYQKYMNGFYKNSTLTTQITTSANAISKPSKTGYTFTGYYSESNGTGTQFFNADGYFASGSGNYYSFISNGSLYAGWEPNVYAVSLNNQSATSAGTTTIYEKYNTGYYTDSGATIQITTSTNKITIPSRTGYTFEGYYTSTNGGGTQYINKDGYITSNVSLTQFTSTGTLYAKWTANKYNATFYANKPGSGTVTQTLNGTGTTTTTNDPYPINNYFTYDSAPNTAKASVTGWTFNGYYTSSSGGKQIYGSDGKIIANVSGYTGSGGVWKRTGGVTLYAQWTAIPYSVGYDANTGTLTGVKNGLTYSFNPNSSVLTLNGTVSNWIDTLISFYPTTMAKGDTFTISIEKTGGSYTSSNTDRCFVCDLRYKDYVNDDAKIDFAGFDGGSKTLTYSNSLSGNINRIGIWIWKGSSTTLSFNNATYKISIKRNNASTTFKNITEYNQSLKYDTASQLAQNTISKTYTVTYNFNYTGSTNSSAQTGNATLNGWKSSVASGTYGSSATNVTANITSSTTIPKTNYVKNITSTADATVIMTAQWGSASITLPTPTRNGYTFDGWYKESGCTTSAGNGGASYSTSSDVTLYAKWKANTYTITYNGNGNTSGSTANSSHTYDTASQLTTNGFVKKYTITYNYNYSDSSNTTAQTGNAAFNGWKSSVAAGTYGNTTANATTTITSNTIITNNYYVKNITATSGGQVTFTAQWGNASITLPTPTRNGYVFDGWYKESACTTSAGAGGASYSTSSNVTLYAKWIDTWVNHASTQAPTTISGGDYNGFYTIGTKEDLAWFANHVNFAENDDSVASMILTSNIDLAGYDWYPIGTQERPYCGEFNGNGYQITNLTTNAKVNNGYAGLFGYIGSKVVGQNIVSANIHNVSLSGATINGAKAGGIVGYAKAGTISNNIVYNSTINGTTVGGIVGEAASTVTIDSNLFSGTLSGTTKGLISSNFNGTISNCVGINTGTGTLTLKGSGDGSNIVNSLKKNGNTEVLVKLNTNNNNTTSTTIVNNGTKISNFDNYVPTNWKAVDNMFISMLPSKLFWIASW